MVRCWSILLLIFGCFAYAGEVELDHEVPVYAKPKLDSRILKYLHTGEKVRVGDLPIHGFRKVNLGADKAGYISEDELSLEAAFDLKSKPYLMGLYGSWRGLHQGVKSFTTSDQVNYQTSGYTGTGAQAGVFLEHHWTDSKAYRVFLGYETTSFNGTATEVGIPISPLSVELAETYIALGGDFKYFPLTDDEFWVAIGGEYARGITVSLKLNGTSVPTSEEDLANLFVALASVGWDLHYGDWFFSPALRAGDAPFAQPNIFVYEASFSVGHSLSF